MKGLVKHGNNSAVNLDLVTSIYEYKGDLKISFMFDSMNKDEINECVWNFDSVAEREQVMSNLNITEI